MIKTFVTTQSDLLIHNNKMCKVISELSESEYDKEEVGLMYHIELEDGTKIQAFEDEIINDNYMDLSDAVGILEGWPEGEEPTDRVKVAINRVLNEIGNAYKLGYDDGANAAANDILSSI